MRSPTARAAYVAAQLAAATGHQPQTSLESNAIRIEVDLPNALSDTASHTVLAALADADHYGYERVGGREYVWAVLDQPKA